MSRAPEEKGLVKKRKRTVISPEQLQKLERLHSEDSFPSRPQKQHLAKEIGKTEEFINIWFQNKRARIKKEKASLEKSSKEAPTKSSESRSDIASKDSTECYRDVHAHHGTYKASEGTKACNRDSSISSIAAKSIGLVESPGSSKVACCECESQSDDAQDACNTNVSDFDLNILQLMDLNFQMSTDGTDAAEMNRCESADSNTPIKIKDVNLPAQAGLEENFVHLERPHTEVDAASVQSRSKKISRNNAEKLRPYITKFKLHKNKHSSGILQRHESNVSKNESLGLQKMKELRRSCAVNATKHNADIVQPTSRKSVPVSSAKISWRMNVANCHKTELTFGEHTDITVRRSHV